MNNIMVRKPTRRRNKRHSRRTRRYKGGYTCFGPECPAGGVHALGIVKRRGYGNNTIFYRMCWKCGCTREQGGPNV